MPQVALEQGPVLDVLNHAGSLGIGLLIHGTSWPKVVDGIHQRSGFRLRRDVHHEGLEVVPGKLSRHRLAQSTGNLLGADETPEARVAGEIRSPQFRIDGEGKGLQARPIWVELVPQVRVPLEELTRNLGAVGPIIHGERGCDVLRIVGLHLLQEGGRLNVGARAIQHLLTWQSIRSFALQQKVQDPCMQN